MPRSDQSPPTAPTVPLATVLLVPLLGVSAAAAYAAVWSLIAHQRCNAPPTSSWGPVFAVAPFALPLIAAAVVALTGAKLNWGRRTIMLSIVAVVAVVAVVGEIIVFRAEFNAHHCGE